MSLNPQYTFARYIASSPRSVTLAECRAHAAGGPSRRPCLILLGPPGVGKTHLLHSIGHAARDRRAGMAVVRTTAAGLASELVEAIRQDHIPDLYRRYAEADVLLIDDLHTLAERPSTQLGIGRIVSGCLEKGVLTACAATCRPRELREFSACVGAACGIRRLVLKRPSAGRVRRILHQDAKDWGVAPPAPVIDRMVRQAGGDVRRALGALARWRLEQRLSAVVAAHRRASAATCPP